MNYLYVYLAFEPLLNSTINDVIELFYIYKYIFMINIDKIFPWILYPNIIVIFPLGINIFRSKIDFIFYKKNYFKLIIFPVTIFLLIGLILYFLEFAYTGQFITLSGTILAACIAYYIALFNNNTSIEKENREKETNLKHIIILLKEGIETIDKEKTNYENFVTNIQNYGIEQSNIETTPFIHFEIIQNLDIKSIYSSIVAIPNKEISLLENIYLEIVKQNSNALFIKKNSELMYVNFTNSFNRSAEKYVLSSFELNETYTNLSQSSSSDPIYDEGFFVILHLYQSLIQQGLINPNFVKDIMQHLHDPIIGWTVARGINDPIKVKILQIMKSFEVNLRKMDEVHTHMTTHFTSLSSDLQFIKEKISSIINQLENK